MLRYALRRALWAIPTLFGVSLVVFLVTTLLPDPAGGEAPTPELVVRDPARFDAIVERRRARFLDLPRFFNSHPADVRTRADAQIAHFVANDAEIPVATHTL